MRSAGGHFSLPDGPLSPPRAGATRARLFPRAASQEMRCAGGQFSFPAGPPAPSRAGATVLNYSPAPTAAREMYRKANPHSRTGQQRCREPVLTEVKCSLILAANWIAAAADSRGKSSRLPAPTPPALGYFPRRQLGPQVLTAGPIAAAPRSFAKSEDAVSPTPHSPSSFHFSQGVCRVTRQKTLSAEMC